MYILDMIFGFIPVLLVVLFIIRIIIAAGKKKKRFQDGMKKQITLDGEVENKPASAPPAPSPSAPAPSPTAAVPQAPSAAEQQYLENEQNMEKREKIILSESESYKVTGISEAAMARLNRLPELKKAVLWSEILGNPKGLE